MESLRFALVFLAVLVTQNIAEEFKHTEHCTEMKPVSVDASKLSGKWFNFVHSADLGYSCSVFNLSYIKNQSGIVKTASSKTRYDNGSVIQGFDDFILPPSFDGYYRNVSDNGNQLIVYAILDSDNATYSVDYLCFQSHDEYADMLWLSTRDLKVPDGALEKTEMFAKQLNQTLEIKPETCKDLD